MRIIRLTYLGLGLIFLLGLSFSKANDCEQAFQVKIHHPGISFFDSTSCVLVQKQCEGEQRATFFMDVASVVCGDSVCRIDTVRLFWDELGFYQRLLMPPGLDLEKAEGAHFSKADYQKLDSILSSRKSSLKDVFKAEIIDQAPGEGQIDAISGASKTILHRDAYIQGAVWTSFTLWHWVNGDVFHHIRNITGGEKSLSELKTYLQSADMNKKIFALEQLIRKGNHEKATLDLVIAQAATDHYPLQKLLIEYVEGTSTENYFSAIQQLMESRNERLRILCLTSLMNSKHEIPEQFFCQLIPPITEWNSYQEINLLFRILDVQSELSPALSQQLLNLLTHESFLIARRAYWFLSEQDLSKEGKQKLEAFYQKHIDAL